MEEGTTKNAKYVAELAEAFSARLEKLEAVASAARTVRFRPGEEQPCWDILADALNEL